MYLASSAPRFPWSSLFLSPERPETQDLWKIPGVFSFFHILVISSEYIQTSLFSLKYGQIIYVLLLKKTFHIKAIYWLMISYVTGWAWKWDLKKVVLAGHTNPRASQMGQALPDPLCESSVLTLDSQSLHRNKSNSNPVGSFNSELTPVICPWISEGQLPGEACHTGPKGQWLCVYRGEASWMLSLHPLDTS